MRTLLFVLLTLVSFSALASVECFVNNRVGEHLMFNVKSSFIDTAAPFGIVRIQRAKGRYYLSSIVNGEETIVSFKKELSLTKQSPMGVSVDGDAALGNIVCK